MPATPPPNGPYDTTSLRAAAVRRLLRLRNAERLTHYDVRTVAAAFTVHWRTVRRWMDNATTHNGTYTPKAAATSPSPRPCTKPWPDGTATPQPPTANSSATASLATRPVYPRQPFTAP